MFAHILLAIVGVTFCVNVVESSAIPSYIKLCKRDDPKIEECIVDSVEHLRPYLKKGIPELNIPPIEPLNIPQLQLLPGNDPKNLAIGKNMKAHGASDFIINKLSLDRSNRQKPVLHLKLTMPRLDFEGDYEINSQTLAIPLKGSGPIKFSAINVHVDCVLHGQIYKKGNKNGLRFTQMDTSLKSEDYTIYLGNLFNGDKVLGEVTNQALNENKKEFLEAINPSITKSVTELVLKLANSVTKGYTYDELFPQ